MIYQIGLHYFICTNLSLVPLLFLLHGQQLEEGDDAVLNLLLLGA